MEPAVPAFLSTKPLSIEPVKLPPVAVQPGLRPFVVDAYLKQAETTDRSASSRFECCSAAIG